MISNNRDQAEVLAEVGVTPPEYALFIAVQYGITQPPSSLPYIAYCEDPDPAGPTEEECRVALTGCLSKGWLQVIDEPALAKIEEQLHDGGFLGPIYGLPAVGAVDFTTAGAELWYRLWHRQWPDGLPPFAYTDGIHTKTARFFRTEAAALAEMEKVRRQKGVVSVTGPTAIGPWRVQWWRRFPEGYRIDIEERGQCVGCGVGGSWLMLPVPRAKADLTRLQHVLDRHNVTLAQWLFLAVMEESAWRSASNINVWAAGSAQRSFGLTIAEEELRSGLEDCFRYGWLRTVDEQVADEIDALLRNDPTLLPLPHAVMIRLGGEIDFTPCGANLYQMIAAEWLGPDWENALWAKKACYWEEHRYCEALEGFQGIVEEHEGTGAVVRGSRVVPIGPWCVYWWEWFPAGYRLELQCGEP